MDIAGNFGRFRFHKIWVSLIINFKNLKEIFKDM